MMDDFDFAETPVRRTSRVPMILAMIAMLCLGMLGGVILEHTVFHPSWRGRGGWRPGGGGPGLFHGMHGPRLMDDRMARALSLTPAQRTQVDSIMSQSMRRIEQVQQQIRPQMRQVFTETHARIDSVLTPEQQTRLRELFPHRGRERGDSGPAGGGGMRPE